MNANQGNDWAQHQQKPPGTIKKEELLFNVYEVPRKTPLGDLRDALCASISFVAG